MPNYKKGESWKDYMKRCGEGRKPNQAVVACYSMYKNKWKAKK